MRRVGRRTLFPGVGVVLGLLIAELTLRTVWLAWKDLHPPRVRLTVAERDRARAVLSGMEEVSLQTADGITLAAWFVPGPKRTAVVFVHGLGGNRAQLLPEATLLVRHGHGVLLFDSRASGESGGTAATWGDAERLDVKAALDFVSARPDVDRSSIGIYGFSVGATPAVLVAAEDARVRAVALGPTWPSLRAELSDKFRALSGHSSALATFIFRLDGANVDALAPEQALTKVSPRPLLLISGSEDPDTPPAVMRQLAAQTPGGRALARRGRRPRWLRRR
jgi:dienelactone hydrolase